MKDLEKFQKQVFIIIRNFLFNFDFENKENLKKLISDIVFLNDKKHFFEYEKVSYLVKYILNKDYSSNYEIPENCNMFLSNYYLFKNELNYIESFLVYYFIFSFEIEFILFFLINFKHITSNFLKVVLNIDLETNKEG